MKSEWKIKRKKKKNFKVIANLAPKRFIIMYIVKFNQILWYSFKTFEQGSRCLFPLCQNDLFSEEKNDQNHQTAIADLFLSCAQAALLHTLLNN